MLGFQWAKRSQEREKTLALGAFYRGQVVQIGGIVREIIDPAGSN